MKIKMTFTVEIVQEVNEKILSTCESLKQYAEMFKNELSVEDDAQVYDAQVYVVSIEKLSEEKTTQQILVAAKVDSIPSVSIKA